MYGPSLLPYVLHSQGPSVGWQNVVDRSAEQYYSWGNIKTQMALNSAAQSMFSDRDNPMGAAGSALVTYGALTAGEKFFGLYGRMLKRFSENHPGFAEFRNTHPIIGNILAWGPGVGLGVAGGAAAFAVGRSILANGMKAGVFNALNANPLVRTLVLGGILVGGLATSFLGIFARKGIGELSDSGKEYREARKVNPTMAPDQLKQLVKATRNQRILNQQLQAQEETRRSQLDPFYKARPVQRQDEVVNPRLNPAPMQTMSNQWQWQPAERPVSRQLQWA